MEKPLSRLRRPNPGLGSDALIDPGVFGVVLPLGDSAPGLLPAGIKERRIPNDESTTPLITLLAESAMASTCCSTRPRSPPEAASAGAKGVSEVTGLRASGIGVRSAVLQRMVSVWLKIETKRTVHTLALYRCLLVLERPYQRAPKIRPQP